MYEEDEKYKHARDQSRLWYKILEHRQHNRGTSYVIVCFKQLENKLNYVILARAILIKEA